MEPTFDADSKTWRGPSVPYPFPMDVMIGDLILKKLPETPDRVVQITANDDKAITCEDLRISSIRVAQNLQKIGVEADDVIGLIAPQSHFATYFINGCVILGALINPLDISLTEKDICSVYTQTKPKIIICEPDAINKVQSALKNVDFSYRIYSTSNESSLFLKASNFLKPTGIEENFKPPKFAKTSEDKILAILCSSGTTGAPKGVCVTNKFINYWAAFADFFPAIKSVSYSSSPLCWASGFYANITTIFSKNEIRIIPSKRSFDVENFLELVEKYQITSVGVAPSQFTMILNHENLSSYDLNSIKTISCFGTIISKTIRDKFAKIFPDKDLMTAYGMTEVSVSMTKPGEFKTEFAVGSMLFPETEIKIVDDDGNALENGQSGEIYVRSNVKFLGYYNNPKATKDAINEDNFIKTGDIGYFNNEGMLFIIDRKKDVLKVKGYQVNTSEIENLIQSIEGVEHVTVVGITDDVWNNLVTAAVVKRKGYEKLSEKFIIDFVASKLNEVRQLHGGVYFFEQFPMTPSGKVQKRLLIEEILARKAH